MSFLQKAQAIRDNSPVLADRRSQPVASESRLPREYYAPYFERSLLDGILYNLGILLRYKWLIFFFTFVAGAAAVGFSILSLRLPPSESPLPNRYRSTAVLLMSSESDQNSTEALLAALGMPPSDSPTDQGETAMLILRSRATLDTLIERFGLREHYGLAGETRATVRDAVAANMSVGYESSTESLRVSFEDIDPQLAHDVVAEMVGLLTEWYSSRGDANRTSQLAVLETKLTDVETAISRLEADIRQIQEEYRVLTIEELATAQSTLLNELRTQRAMKELEIKNYEEFSRIDDPRMAQLRIELANLTELIRQVEAGEYASMPALDQVPNIAARFARLTAELTLQERLHQTLSEQYEVARLTDFDQTFFEVLEAPEVPDEKSGPSRARLTIGATAGGLFLGVALAVLLHVIGTIRKDPRKMRILEGERWT